MSRLQQASYGPFTKGVVQEAGASLDLTGALKSAVGVAHVGVGKFGTRNGNRVALTLMDDQGTPAEVDAVCALVPFSDAVLAVAWSESQQDVYLYRLSSAMDDWYDATGALQGTTSPEPVGVLWSTVTTAPDVTIAEGLGVAYIAHTEPVASGTLTYATRTFEAPGTLADLQADLDGGGAADVFFAGVISFQQHLWGWGFGAGVTAGTGYRPEMARFGGAIFTAFQSSDSLTIGNRVRSQREAIIGAGIAGQSLYLGAPYMLTRITGFGRDSWYKEPVDDSYGFTGPKCMVTAGDVLYYWSSRGPMRIGAGGKPEPLWDPVTSVVESVANPAKIVAAFDVTRDWVTWTYDESTAGGTRLFVAYDVRRGLFAVAGDDWGQTIRCAGTIAPVASSTAAGVSGPSASPSSASTTNVGTTSAQANWTNGDVTAPSTVEIRAEGGSTYTAYPVSAGVSLYVFTGLSSGVDYEWRIAHVKHGSTSTYVGPVAATQFTTTVSGGTLLPPTSLALTSSELAPLKATWTNSGEASVQTECYLSGPSVGAPSSASYVLQTTKAAGVASHTFSPTSDGTYWVKVRHIRSGATESAFAGPESLAIDIIEPT